LGILVTNAVVATAMADVLDAGMHLRNEFLRPEQLTTAAALGDPKLTSNVRSAEQKA
jgi:hypothetical protein